MKNIAAVESNIGSEIRCCNGSCQERSSPHVPLPECSSRLPEVSDAAVFVVWASGLPCLQTRTITLGAVILAWPAVCATYSFQIDLVGPRLRVCRHAQQRVWSFQTADPGQLRRQWCDLAAAVQRRIWPGYQHQPAAFVRARGGGRRRLPHQHHRSLRDIPRTRQGEEALSPKSQERQQHLVSRLRRPRPSKIRIPALSQIAVQHISLRPPISPILPPLHQPALSRRSIVVPTELRPIAQEAFHLYLPIRPRPRLFPALSVPLRFWYVSNSCSKAIKALRYSIGEPELSSSNAGRLYPSRK